MFGFILAQAYSYMTTDVDALNNEIANAIASHEPEQRILGLDQYLRADPHHVKLGGLFAADGHRIAGNIETLPPMLHGDAGSQLASLIKIDDGSQERHAVRAVARALPEGGTLVIARSDYEFTWIAHIVERTLAVGLIPARRRVAEYSRAKTHRGSQPEGPAHRGWRTARTAAGARNE